jgi:hypothetical protein
VPAPQLLAFSYSNLHLAIMSQDIAGLLNLYCQGTAGNRCCVSEVVSFLVDGVPWVDCRVRDWPFGPSATAVAHHHRGYIQLADGSTMHLAKEHPSGYFHGTTVEAGLLVVAHGLLSAKEIVQSGLDDTITKWHRPDGIYSFCNQDVSDKSMYVQGCQCHFRSYGVIASEKASKSFVAVPEGVIARCKRSVATRLGEMGQEYVHHKSNIDMMNISFDLHKLLAALQKSFQQTPKFSELPLEFRLGSIAMAGWGKNDKGGDRWGRKDDDKDHGRDKGKDEKGRGWGRRDRDDDDNGPNWKRANKGPAADTDKDKADLALQCAMNAQRTCERMYQEAV